MVNASPLAADGEGGSPTSCSAHMHSSSFWNDSNGVRDGSDPLGVESPTRAGQSLVDSARQGPDTARYDQLPLLIEEQLRHLVGEPLSAVDRASVQLAPLRSCTPGEIVAVADSDGVLRYGKVRGEEEPSCGGEVKVQVSMTCIRWYAVSQIYFFQSVGARRSAKDVDIWTNDWELKRAEASTVGVVAEVNALLARLNVSLSTSYEELLAEMLRLQHRAALAEEDQRAAQKLLEQALREKRDAEKALICVVCLTDSVDRVLVPCGHSFCLTCIQRLHRDAPCPVCRHEIADSAAFRVS